jgi:hypothetical protein
MQTLSTLLRLEIGSLLAILGMIVAYQILTGRIHIQKMLFDKATGHFSPGRVQLLLLTLMTVFYQVLQVLKDPTEFPNIPQEALLVLFGGNLAYLGGKFYSSSPRRQAGSMGQTQKSRRAAK